MNAENFAWQEYGKLAHTSRIVSRAFSLFGRAPS